MQNSTATSSRNSLQLSPFFVYVLVWLLILMMISFHNASQDFSATSRTTIKPSKTQRLRDEVGKDAVQHQKQSKNGEIPSKFINIVFSTDCSLYQQWQSLLLFHSAYLVKQPGWIVRIASGCTSAQQVEMTQQLKKLYPDQKYYIHFTPDYTVDSKERKYLYYNKSKGLKDLLNSKYSFLHHDESWIAFIDPDFLFLRPLISKETKIKASEAFNDRNTILWPLPPVYHGIGQYYEIGSPWTDENYGFHRREVCGNNSKCVTIDEEEVEKHYTVGSPYVLRVGDWKRLVMTWTEFATRLYDFQPIHMSEMYAYSMAAAHESLPHEIYKDFMISNVNIETEGWKWIDALPHVCSHFHESTELMSDTEERNIIYGNNTLPTFIHYCQKYSISSSNLTWSKYEIAHQELFKCSSIESEDEEDAHHINILKALNYNITKSLPSCAKNIQSSMGCQTFFQLKYNSDEAAKVKRNAFIICTIKELIRKTLKYYRDHICS